MKRLIILTVMFFSFCFSNFAAAQGFDLESPNLDKPAEKKETKKDDIGIGDFGGLNFGVLFDVRYMAVGNNAPGTVVHVDELNITGNIGDNISLLVEQLLPTSQQSGLEDQIGDDHGFAYAIFSNTSFLPAGTAFKIGRFRFKWGIDAVLDSPANPIYPLTRKNLGFVSDRGIELSGFLGEIDYTIGLADGPGFTEEIVTDSLGKPIGVVNKSIKNNVMPLIVRLSNKFSSSKISLSYFNGNSWGYSNFMDHTPNKSFRASHPGGAADRSILLLRQHGAIDYSLRWDKFDLALEYSQGLDTDSTLNKSYRTTGYFSRLDYAVKPQKMNIQLQYDQYGDGHENVKDEKSLSAGLQLFIQDQAFIRIGYMYNRLGLTSEEMSGMFENTGFMQFYLPL